MPAKWGFCAILLLCLALMVGCRATHPELKPAKTKETLVEPPRGFYETPGYPKAAYDKMVDPGRNAFDVKNGDVMPTRGGAPAGMGGMGGR